MDGCMDEGKRWRSIDGRMDGYMDIWMDEWMDGLMDVRMDRWTEG